MDKVFNRGIYMAHVGNIKGRPLHSKTIDN